jgi:hypothetical protein
MTDLEKAIKVGVSEALLKLDRHEQVTLSTCTAWESGDINPVGYQAVRYIAMVLENKGYVVSRKCSYGVDDYTVYPKVDLAQF